MGAFLSRHLVRALLAAVLLVLPHVAAGTLWPERFGAALADDDGDDGGGGGSPGGGGGSPGGGGGGGANTGAEGGGGGGGNDWRLGGRDRRGRRAEQRFRWPWEPAPRVARLQRPRVQATRERQRRPVQARPAQVRPARAAPATPRPVVAAGARVDAIPRELVLSSVAEPSVEALRRAGFRVLSERAAARAGGGRLLRVRVPSNLSMERSLLRAREVAPEAVVDRNHVFRSLYRLQSGAATARRAFADPLGAVGWPEAAACLDGVAIGVIDTGVDLAHPALAGKPIEPMTTRSEGRAPSAPAHGTALALLLLGDGRARGLAPNARLVAVDAFHRRDGQDVADAFDLAAALDVMFERGVAVINLSLAGPENATVDAAGRALAERGARVVAAVGNDGPAATPRFPAAYPWAVAVTAIDQERGAYARAVRGPHVGLAAPGVRLAILDARGRERFLTGTSFATPFVAAALAARGTEPNRLDGLVATATDLGEPGRDPVYGHGLMRFPGACAP
jgi:hypothetical protein